MSIIAFLKEFAEASEDLAEEEKKRKQAFDTAKFNSKKRRR